MPDATPAAALLRDLVRINSVNPSFSGGATNEREIASFVARALAGAGQQVISYEPEPGRVSVVGRRPGAGTGRSLILYAHLDTVGTEGMDDPFGGTVRDGKLYGRGAYDMKGGLAACIATAQALHRSGTALAGDLYVVGVADEEVASIGMQEVLRHLRADGAIVTEPTELDVCLAHKGFCWIEVTTRGRAAHGSRFDLGIDANLRMGRVLHALEGLEQELRASPPHPLVGPPSLHAAKLRGGTGESTYAAECQLTIERRTIPGETPEQALREIAAILEALKREDPAFAAEARLLLARDPFEARAHSSIVTHVEQAVHTVLGRRPRRVGQTPWMDAAYLSAAGVDTVVIGPGGAGAHAAEEWVDIDSVLQLAEILVRTATAYCGATPAS